MPPAGESSGPAEHAAGGMQGAQQVSQRSGLWQAVEAERRRTDAVDSNPHRLSEAQRQELRDQIRRASSLRDDNAVMSPAMSRP